MNSVNRDWGRLVFPALLGMVVAVMYAFGLRNELVFDDGRLTDGTVRDGYASLWQLKQRLLSYGSFNWVQALAGENWPLQRVVNVLLHLATCMALYRFFSLLLSRIAYPEETRADPAFATSQRAALRVGVLVFALNPVAVYAVAYLIQRSVVMATLFGVLACWGFAQALLTRKAVWHGVALTCYGLAVLSKEQALLLALLSVPLYVFLARPVWQRVAAMVALVAVLSAAGLALFLRWYPDLIGQLFDETSRQLAAQIEQQQAGALGHIYALSVLNQAALFFYYGALWLLPNVGWMSIDMRPPFPLTLTAMPHLVGAVAYVALLAASSVAVLRRSDAFGFVGLCLLFPVVLYWTEFATVWIQDPMVLYRSYLWAIALPGLIAVVLTGFSPRTLTKLAVLLAVVLAGLSTERVLSLNSELTVWTDAVDKVDVRGPANAVGRYRAFLNRGAYHLGRFAPEPAMEDFKKAMALGEPAGSAAFNLGVAQQLLKKHTDALASFAKAEAAGYKEGSLYYHRGESQYAAGQFALAMDSYTTSLALPQADEVLTQSRQRRADAAMQLQRYAQAAADFELLLAKQPQQPGALAGLGFARLGAGNGAGAADSFTQLLALKPAALGFYGRALANASLGNKAAAQEDIGKAVQLEPGNALYRRVQDQWKSGAVTLSIK